MTHERPLDDSSSKEPRRAFFKSASGMAMAAGLAGGYGSFGYMLGQFVYPAASNDKGWLFVCTVDQLAVGGSLNFVTPAGAKIVVARQGEGQASEDFLALSSVCPHLGCRVHWEVLNERFFCPCHNGAFDRAGVAISGPPKDASQSLARFPIKVEKGLVFLEAPLTSVTSSPVQTAPGTLGGGAT